MSCRQKLLAAAWFNLDAPFDAESFQLAGAEWPTSGIVETCAGSPTFLASYVGSAKALRFILSLGKQDIDREATHGMTPLAAACMRGGIACARILLCSGAKPTGILTLPRRLRQNQLSRWVSLRLSWSEEMFCLVLTGSYQEKHLALYTEDIQEVAVRTQFPEAVLELVLQYACVSSWYGATIQ